MVLAASVRIVVVAVVALAAVSCGNDDTGSTIVVGAGDSVESLLLADVYSGALARTGARTAVEPHLGARPDYLAALDANRASLVGEHNGELLAFFDGAAAARTPAQVNAALSKSLPEGLVVSDSSDGTDMRPRVLLTEERAARDGVRSVGELAPRCGDLTVGVAPVPGVLDRSVAAPRVADCVFAGTVVFTGAAELRKALQDGEIQVGILSGPPTFAPEATDGFAILSDDHYAVRAENVLPVIRKGVLDEREIKKLNYVAGELTTDEFADMIRRVRDGASPAELARTWLDAHGL